MNRLIITIDVVYDRPLSEEDRVTILDRFYAALARDENILTMRHAAPFDQDVTVEMRDDR